MITHQQRHEARAQSHNWMEPPRPCLILPNEKNMHHTTPHSRFCALVDTGFGSIFSRRIARRPAEDRGAVVFLHNEGLTTAEICRRTGFERRFVTRWISRHHDSGSLNDAAGAGRERELSKCGAECGAEMKRKRHARVE